MEVLERDLYERALDAQRNLTKHLRATAPWVNALPESDVEEFVRELLTVVARVYRHAQSVPGELSEQDLLPIAEMLREWRATAEVYADGDAAAELLDSAGDENVDPIPLRREQSA